MVPLKKINRVLDFSKYVYIYIAGYTFRVNELKSFFFFVASEYFFFFFFFCCERVFFFFPPYFFRGLFVLLFKGQRVEE